MNYSTNMAPLQKPMVQGAFELGYPNYIDRIFEQKTGYGIWIHGTEFNKPVATRGCISTNNSDLMELSQFIELHKTIVIVEEKVNYLPLSQLKSDGEDIYHFLMDWKKNWESEDTEAYLRHYAKNFKTDRFQYQQWIDHKRRVNRKNEEAKN